MAIKTVEPRYLRTEKSKQEIVSTHPEKFDERSAGFYDRKPPLASAVYGRRIGGGWRKLLRNEAVVDRKF